MVSYAGSETAACKGVQFPQAAIFPDTISKDLESAHHFVYKGGMCFNVFYIYLHGISAAIFSIGVIRCSFL